jgi:hypothetical protein
VSVPVRGDVPVFAAIAMPTGAVPDPLGVVAIASQAAWLAIVHVHEEADVVTVNDCVLAAAETSSVSGLTRTVHVAGGGGLGLEGGGGGGGGVGAGVSASCDTTYAWPAICTVPLRGCDPFPAIAIVTRPSPLPVWPSTTVIQSTWLAAVHAHEACADTAMVRVPPEAPRVSPLAPSAKTQGEAA